MPKVLSSSPMTKRRYAAKVEKGENAWRREWSSFMSGVNMKELQKGGVVVLPKGADLEATSSNNYDGAISNFSYLFSSPAEKKAARLTKEKEEKEKLKKLQKAKYSNDPLAHLSKHERALREAKEKGLKLDGMTRKEARNFLHLTVSKEQKEAERHQGEFRPHELMDEKLQWYQQGPHPVDLIAEKLVMRKAIKNGKQQGLRYNYLMPHASWLAKRNQKRRERVLVGLGRRYLFDDEGRMMDMFGAYVDIVPTVDSVGDDSSLYKRTTEKNKEKKENRRDEDETRIGPVDKQEICPTSVIATPSVCYNVLVDPQQACNSFVRAVVRDREVAAAIQKANISTTYLSSSLVMGPSIGLEDSEESPLLPQKREREVPVQRVKEVTKRSKNASFEPYLPE